MTLLINANFKNFSGWSDTNPGNEINQSNYYTNLTSYTSVTSWFAYRGDSTAIPAIKYRTDGAADSTIEVRYVVPETTQTQDYELWIIYRFQDPSNFRYLKIVHQVGGAGVAGVTQYICIGGVHSDTGSLYASFTYLTNHSVLFNLISKGDKQDLVFSNQSTGQISTVNNIAIGSTFQNHKGVGFFLSDPVDIIGAALDYFRVYDYVIVGTGGTILGGTSTVAKFRRSTDISAGGVVCGSSAIVAIRSRRVATGGVRVGGASNVKVLIFAKGGVRAGGSSSISIGFSVKGGLKVAGTANLTFVDYVNSIGGAVARGSAIVSKKKFYRHVATGTAIVGGSSKYGIKNRKYTTTGGIEISGTGFSNLKFLIDLSFLWNTSGRIETDITFLWNTGRLLNYWYRIIAKDKCHDPCCQRYIMNIHARSLSEICDKLATRRYKMTIESAQRFLLPADNSEIKNLKSQGVNVDDDCNTFIDVPLCQIPRCEEFCVDFDMIVDFDFDIIRTSYSGSDYYASGNIFITGSAESRYESFIPNFPHIASGGIIIGGGAGNRGSGYYHESSGGIFMGGDVYPVSSAWRFIGGESPSTTRVRVAEETESLREETGDQEWSLTDRVIVDDGLFSSTDISYGSKSEFLIIKGFDFNIPLDSDILHFYVTVQRKSNQLGVRDLGAYIISRNDIISENQAKIGIDWPYMIESQTVYDFTDIFDVDDLNDHSIGFALRAESINLISPTIASIDFITVEIVYESSQNQRIRIAGSANIVSSAFNWIASGGIEIDGKSKNRLGAKYKPNGRFVRISGQYELGLPYEASGGPIVAGSAVCRPSFQYIETFGGVLSGGNADVKPYFEFGIGGAKLIGTSRVSARSQQIASGGIIISSSNSDSDFIVVGIGGITMGGVALRRTNHWNYRPDGNVTFVLGGSDYNSSDIGKLMQDLEFNMTVDQILVQFDLDKDLQDAKALTNRLDRCGCGDIPLTLNLEHAIARDNNLAQFLRRNSLKISDRLRMQYNLPNDSWQTNLHYKGLSSDSNSEETWNIMFDVKCTYNLGSIFIGRQIWNLSMEVVRKNLTTGENFNTRVTVGVLPDEICSANELKFKFVFDTQTEFTEITPTASIYQSILYDDVGLFKTNSWRLNPDLIFTVSQAGLDSYQKRIDLTTQVLV